ncbi:cysteine-rich and transmembrane domain-containing protein WIH1-like [Brachypodium distachyon]|uniref:Cysteine-rich transmembrane domain-containing protein n=1 Tax=Brachypodium distachyon TaxID=15368 RepID=I1HV67_BRADI|nr:cysteine-rich and transmembrane domain-containing protein WIH1-like [Brachypodium distachyon]KQK11535.1 hypothetical protein BRADI_2g60705v3 [Brachypodium distachyon]|eukprot:XP_024313979.1 cysteine-rich and transmembrane domain-containing protein WIH1-like [Brachypodium distachyon]
MENNRTNQQQPPPPPPGYPTLDGEQGVGGGKKKARTSSRGEKGFLEGCIAALCCCWICEMCCD